MKRSASAYWRGDLRAGKGQISTESGVLDQTPYSFSTRFESGKGTNPEELVAAAHAGCFTMALAAELGKLGVTPDTLHTTATVTLEKDGSGFSVTESHLETRAKIAGGDSEVFRQAAMTAETGCPISKLLKAKITLDAKLES